MALNKSLTFGGHTENNVPSRTDCRMGNGVVDGSRISHIF